MADELVLYTNPRSRGRIARWMLEEVGQPYRTEILDFATTMKAPAYLAINPMGKVPAVRHGDAVVTETAAICAYLADAFPQTELAPPPSDRLRAPYYRWMFFTAGRWRRRPATRRGFHGAARTRGHDGLRQPAISRHLKVLEEAVSRGDYLVGGTFTAADVYVGSHVGFGLMFGTLEKRPAFQQYWQRLSARPAYARARELDEALQAKP
jgi:glutathione S-transferase